MFARSKMKILLLSTTFDGKWTVHLGFPFLLMVLFTGQLRACTREKKFQNNKHKNRNRNKVRYFHNKAYI